MISKNKHIKEIMQYCKDIQTNKLISGMYCKKAINRFLNDLKRQKDEDFIYAFNEDAVIDVIEFVEKLFIPDLNKRLELLPWMKFIYANLFGWVHKLDNSRRRFRSSYCEVARKNSKTTSLLFPIIIYDFKRTQAAESFFVSKDGAQSAKTYNELKQIFIESFNVNPKEITITENGIKTRNSFIQFFSSETRGVDSYKNSCSVVDEFHHYSDDKVITAFKYGGRARKNNLVLIITSAGTDISGPCYAENEKARKILNGILTDETYFTIIYAYDEGDDWKDNRNFIKANPSLDVILRPEILENDLQDAIITPSHQADFKAKTTGIWSNDVSNWIPLQKWEELNNNILPIEDFYGEPCFAGLDLSSVGDFSALTLCFKRNEIYYLFHKFYVPSETISERYKHENINIGYWINAGIVTAIPGAVIDYDYIEHDFDALSEKYNIIELAYDRWNSNKFIENLDEKHTKTLFIQFDQSIKRMAQPTKDFEKLIYEKKIVDNNPCMKWHISNAIIRPDINNNYKPMKAGKSSTARIDGVISSIMALSRCIENNEVYNTTKDFNKILRLF